MVTDLRQFADNFSTHFLRQLEQILGRLNHVALLCPPLLNFISEAIQLLRDHIRVLKLNKLSSANITDADRDAALFRTPSDVSKDLYIAAAILAQT